MVSASDDEAPTAGQLGRGERSLFSLALAAQLDRKVDIVRVDHLLLIVSPHLQERVHRSSSFAFLRILRGEGAAKSETRAEQALDLRITGARHRSS